MNALRLPALVLSTLFFAHNPAQAQCTSCSHTASGSASQPLLVTAGQTLCYTSGTYSGAVSVESGGTLCIATGAVVTISSASALQGSIINHGTLSISSGTFSGQLDNYGSLLQAGDTLSGSLINRGGANATPGAWVAASGAQIDNYGNLNLSSLSLAGATSITNRISGQITIAQSFALSAPGSLIENFGSIQGLGSQWSTGATNTTLINRGLLHIPNGSFTAQDSVSNHGLIQTGQEVAVYGSGMTNYCRLITGGGFFNYGTFANDGLIWATAANAVDATVSNAANATFTNSFMARVRGQNFTNDGSVQGCGLFYFTGTTTNNGPMTGESSSRRILFYDSSITNPPPVFIDNQTVAPSFTSRPMLSSFTIPDTANCGTCTEPAYIALTNCGTQIITGPLPVGLKDFQARYKGPEAGTELMWQTASEHDILYFEVEKSQDGRQFNSLSRIAANGGSDGHTYRFTDISGWQTGAPGMYYRLRLTGPDGSQSFSRTISISQEATGSLKAYPNPFSENLGLQYQAENAEQLGIQLTDLSGRVLLSETLPVHSGHNQLQLQGAADLPPGIYMLVIQTSSARHTSRVVKQ